MYPHARSHYSPPDSSWTYRNACEYLTRLRKRNVTNYINQKKQAFVVSFSSRIYGSSLYAYRQSFDPKFVTRGYLIWNPSISNVSSPTTVHSLMPVPIVIAFMEGSSNDTGNGSGGQPVVKWNKVPHRQ
jgi:hypothetical protein